MENIYQGGFSNWEDVISNFYETYAMSEEQKKALLELEPEPEEVFIASYGGFCYEGYAVVAFRRGDQYFWVEGSHCSCYGLEGQWNPEQYDKETFIKMLDRRLENADVIEYPSSDKVTLSLIRKRAANQAEQ